MEPTPSSSTANTTTTAESQEDTEVIQMLEQLKKDGFYLSSKGIYEILDSCEENAPIDKIKSKILNADFRLIGSKSISPIKGTTTSIEGPIVLQVSNVVNILRSTRSQGLLDTNQTFTQDRILVLRLTDGVNTFKSLESNPPLKPLNGILPGTKIMLKGKLEVKNSMILLTSDNFEVLGGKVDRIVSEWRAEKLQRRFKGVTGAPKFVALTPEDIKEKKTETFSATSPAFVSKKNANLSKQQPDVPKKPAEQQSKRDTPKKSVEPQKPQQTHPENSNSIKPSIVRPKQQQQHKQTQQQQNDRQQQNQKHQSKPQSQPRHIQIVRKDKQEQETPHKLQITRKTTPAPQTAAQSTPSQQQQQPPKPEKTVVTIKIVRKNPTPN